ncbi:MAG: conjugal transfer protein TraN [Legionellaceae bacterium]|nr:conjugal transfer protein TraN [Legionellaceae bacterium]
MKRLLPLLLLISGMSHAGAVDPLKARDAALQNLRAFRPDASLPYFTGAPVEVKTNPNQTGSMSALQAEASSRVQQDQTARFTMQEGRKHETEVRPDISQETARGEYLIKDDAEAPSDIPCADGSCDKTVAEESNDVGEGLTSLGTLAGTAEDAALNQAQSTEAKVFSGAAQQCKSLPLGLHDCCTGSGPLEWLVNCPNDLQELQRAKLEGRVVYLGSYKRHKAGHKHHMHCVFPTKLAGIVQIQGRLGQLNISFGNPKYPNCRGLTPEEIGRINFSALNLTSLTEGFTSRTKTPSDTSLDAGNTSHASKLYDQGVAHD